MPPRTPFSSAAVRSRIRPRVCPPRTPGMMRHESELTSAAQNAAHSARQTASRAAGGLSRITTSAGPMLSRVATRLQTSLASVGGRSGRLIAWTEKKAVPWSLYYSRVAWEVSKIVFRGQRMSPPSVSSIQAYLQRAWQAVQTPVQTMRGLDLRGSMQRLRSTGTPEMVTGAVVLAECLGFFAVGEMLGKFKIIGYHGVPASAHH